MFSDLLYALITSDLSKAEICQEYHYSYFENKNSDQRKDKSKSYFEIFKCILSLPFQLVKFFVDLISNCSNNKSFAPRAISCEFFSYKR